MIRAFVRPHVRCEECDYVQVTERRFLQPETFHIICHGCEGVLRVEVPADMFHTHIPAQPKEVAWWI